MHTLLIDRYNLKANIQIVATQWHQCDEYRQQFANDIRARGDALDRKTNLKADMTEWAALMHEPLYQPLREFVSIAISRMPNFAPRYRKYNLNDMWGGIYRKGDHAQLHDHDPATYSWVYYVEANPQEHPPLVFTQIDGGFEFYPETGSLVVFPGWMSHYVPEQTSNNERIIIAGNITGDNHENTWEVDNES